MKKQHGEGMLSLTHPQQPLLTYNAAEEAQAGGIAFPAVSGTLSPGWGQGNAQPDRSVKFPTARLHRHNWAEGCLVP